MAYYFEHVKLLSYEHRPVFLGAGLRYRVEKRLKITGRLKDDDTYSGAKIVLSKEALVLDSANNYQDILLNGISFGSGRIDSIDFAGGTLARDEDYTFNISCFEAGDLSGAVSGVYAGLSWPSPEKLEQITESLSFQLDDKGDSQYSHEIAIGYLNAGGATAAIVLAKALATIFFNAASGLGAFLGSYSNISLAKKLHTESYNQIDGACSFSETALIPANTVGNYAYNVSYSLQTGQDGFTNIEENCSIQGLTNPPYAGASEGLAALKNGAYTRCAAIYAAYGLSNATLKTTPLSRGISINKFTGDIAVKTTFSNNPKYNSAAIWEYNISASRDNDGYYTMQESGSVIGQGAYNSEEKFFSADSFYDASVAPSCAARCNTLYQSSSGRSGSLTLSSHTRQEDKLIGKLTYSFTYTDNTLFSAGAIKRSEYSLSISKAVPLAQVYGIFNYGEIAQNQYQSSLSTIEYSVSYKGKRDTSINTYLTAAKSFINANLPSTSDRYISACQYSIRPESNDFSLRLTILYSNTNKAFTDTSID